MVNSRTAVAGSKPARNWAKVRVSQKIGGDGKQAGANSVGVIRRPINHQFVAKMLAQSRQRPAQRGRGEMKLLRRVRDGAQTHDGFQRHDQIEVERFDAHRRLLPKII